MLAWRRHTNRPVSSEKYMLCHLVNVFRTRATFENTSRGNEAKATGACALVKLECRSKLCMYTCQWRTNLLLSGGENQVPPPGPGGGALGISWAPPASGCPAQ